MSGAHTIVIDWDSYRPPAAMQAVISGLNRRPVDELLAALPPVAIYRDTHLTFDYRIYSASAHDEVEKVYVLINGFAERAGSPDSGIKNLCTDLLLKQLKVRGYAILVVGGLFSFPAQERSRLLKKKSGALNVVAEGVTSLLRSKFKSLKTVTVSGYSMGGVLSPLVARAILKRGIALVDQVSCGESNYVNISTPKRHLMRRVSQATAYRNEQIKATAIAPYIAVKKTPGTALAMMAYRAEQYRPLLVRSLSMRLIVRDLALQAQEYPSSSSDIQLGEALRYIAKKGGRLNLLQAEHSLLCDKQAFNRLVGDLTNIAGDNLWFINVVGPKADHGVEEQRSLSTPFLVMPEIYLAT